MSKLKMIPFPQYPIITNINRIEDVSIILVSGANTWTKDGEIAMGWRYKDVNFTHAELYLQDGDVLSMGVTPTIINFYQGEVYQKSNRYICISFDDMTQGMKQDIIRIAYERAGSNETKFKLYGFRNYLGMLARILPFLNKWKIFHSTQNNEICSQQVGNVLTEGKYSIFSGVDTARMNPDDIFDPYTIGWPHSNIKELVLI
jgi:hypothetical protein